MPLRVTAASRAGAQRAPENEEEEVEVGWQEKLFSQVGAVGDRRDLVEWVRSEGITGVIQSDSPAQACVQLALKYL